MSSTTIHVILVIEDNPLTQRKTRAALEEAGFQVFVASDGASGLRMAEAHRPDLIVQDTVLPDMSGFDLNRQLRALAGGGRVPIVAITGFLPGHEAPKAALATFDDVLVKPVDLAQLVATIRAHLGEAATAGALPPRPRVLLADDDAAQLRLAKRLLEHGDHELAAAVGAEVLLPRTPHLEEVLCALTSRLGVPPSGQRAPDVRAVHDLHEERVPRQLERQAAMNAAFARRASLQETSLELLAAISETLASRSHVEAALEETLCTVLDVCGLPGGAIFLREERKRPRLVASCGFPVGTLAELETFCGRADVLEDATERGGTVVIHPDVPGGAAGRILGALSAASVILTPLVSLSGPVGALMLASKGRELEKPEWRSFARMIGVHIGQAIALGRAVKRLSDSEHRYRTVVEHANDGIFLMTPGARILDCNPRAEALLGLPRSQIIGRHTWEFTPEPVRQEVAAATLANFGSGTSSVPNVPIARGTETRLVDFSLSSITMEGERVVLSIAHDVTERALAEEALRASEAQFRSMVENVPGVFWKTDAEGRPALCNRRVQDISGFTPEEILADNWKLWFERIDPTAIAAALAAHQTLIDAGTPMNLEYRFQHKDGRWLWINSRAGRVFDADGRWHVEGFATDITDRKRLQQQLVQAQKMEAVGQLSGGVAHDFNNLLAVILSHAGFLKEELAEGDARREDAEQVIAAATRAASLTRQLLAFSRRQVLEPTVLDLNVIVSGMQKMLGRLIGENIELVTVGATDLGAVKADPGQIEQVVMNLAVNARDAMPAGGRLTFQSANVELDASSASPDAPMPAGSYVMLSVSDTGTGMSEQTQQHIFEPFFTTKELGKGTGLGLSTVYGIVKQSDGFIWVYSELGVGTVFKIYLPRVTEETSARWVPATAAPHASGTETVLLVEDDEGVRTVAQRILRGQGYQVIAAADGAEAVELCRTWDRPIHLVLSDVVMPNRSGPDIVEDVRRLRPQARLLLMSGYTEHTMLRDEKLRAGIAFMQKPFTPQALSRKVREVLDAA